MLVRCLALVAALQTSGVASLYETACPPDDDCPLEKAGKECTPGCPTCHLSARVVVKAPVVTVVGAVRIAPTPAPSYEGHAPRPPALPGLYRPPR